MRKLSLILAISTTLFASCRTVQYVPYKVTETIRITDTTYLRWTDTLVRVEKARISDFSGLLDTLYLEVPLARSTAFVDTATATLRGTLEQSGSMPVKIVERERVVTRDSVVYQEKPVPVEVVKRERYVPWFYRLFAVIGIASLAVAVFWALRRFKVL